MWHAHSYVLAMSIKCGGAQRRPRPCPHKTWASDVDRFVGNESGQLCCPKGARHGGCAYKKAWIAFLNIVLESRRVARRLVLKLSQIPRIAFAFASSATDSSCLPALCRASPSAR